MKVLLVSYDNASYVHHFPTGLAYLAAVLREAKHDVSIYSQDIHHYPDEHLTAFLDAHRFDAVGVGVCGGYYQYAKLLKISTSVNASKHRPHFIIGGHGPSPEPGYFMEKTGADAVVVGEGEKAVFDALEGRGVFRSPLVEDVDSIPFPAYDLFQIEIYRLLREMHAGPTDFVMPMISGRGCTFKCNFCYRMDEGFRPRSADSIIDEIRLLRDRWGINYITFSDELLMSSVKRTTSLCTSFLDAGLKFKWFCNGRLNYAKPDVLALMKRAGCVGINYGIEAVDDQILKNMNKNLNVDQIVTGIENTLAAGISPGFNIIFGNIGENQDVLDKDVAFLLKYDDGAHRRTIRPVTPYPGTALYYHAIEKGLLKDVADFYENKHVNSDLLAVNFTDMTDDEFHAALGRANTVLLDNYHAKQAESVRRQIKSLYTDRDASFRGFRQN
jgi:anaerobic magnesium-protoporphyrin IX monomethyl ester cyclase